MTNVLTASEAWPVTPKKLLTDREREFFDMLTELYPTHRIFVQVALSQLIDIPQDHPDRSIRNYFSQLVADFVLCGPNLSIVAVIEVDDRSHRHPNRQAADVRKNKALADAGLRLLRIAEGPLPSAADLRKLVEALGPSIPRKRTSINGKLVRQILFRLAIGAALVTSWYGLAHKAPHLVQSTLQPAAGKAHAVAPARIGEPRSDIDLVAPTLSPRRIAPSKPATSHDAESTTVSEANRQMQLAWSAYYQAPPTCDHPVDWDAQVACGNRYIQAKRAFEVKWAKDNGTVPSPARIELDNRSVNMQPE